MQNMEKCIDLSKSNYKTHVPLDIVAFTYAEDGTIQGEYRIDGKTYGTPSRRREYRFIL